MMRGILSEAVGTKFRSSTSAIRTPTRSRSAVTVWNRSTATAISSLSRPAPTSAAATVSS
jgi:hypothetical protein